MIDDVQAHAVLARDALIEQLRNHTPSASLAHGREALRHVNLAISEIVGVDYPTHGVRQQSLSAAHKELEKAVQILE